MKVKYQDWLIYRSTRLGLVIGILSPVLILSFVNIGSWEFFLSRIEQQFVQEYYLFALLAFIFSYMLLNKKYRNVIFFFGLSTAVIGLTHAINFVYYWKINTSAGVVDYVYGTFLALPSIALLSAIFLIWRQQGLSFENNSRNERIIASLGLLLTLVLMIAEFIPWVRSIHEASSKTWEFKASGSNTYVRECCFVTDGGIDSVLQIYLPLITFGLLFLVASLGFRVPIASYFPSMLWCVQESIDFLTTLGDQNPFEVWSSKEVLDYGLTLRNEGMIGGYLFVAGVVSLLIILLAPRILEGRDPNNFD